MQTHLQISMIEYETRLYNKQITRQYVSLIMPKVAYCPQRIN